MHVDEGPNQQAPSGNIAKSVTGSETIRRFYIEQPDGAMGVASETDVLTLQDVKDFG